MSRVDVVVVSYQSREHLRACVSPLAGVPGVQVTVVDNASTDGSLETVADLRVTCVALRSNRGFGAGCNRGWRMGDAPLVLFLNPDARIDPVALERLVAVLEADPGAGAIAPRTIDPDGSLVRSLRRFPSLRSTYARALFLHRLLPAARWVDEVVRDEAAYARPGSVEWASGACLLVRREALALVDGFDEGFFLYCEETDLCRRLRDAGYELRYEPEAVCVHVGGASAPRTALLPVLAESRIRYARKHRGALAAALERVGIALEAGTHLLATGRGRAARVGHARALRLALRPGLRERAA